MAEMDRILQEKRFAQILEDVKRLAREQGNTITSDQVREAFSELTLSETQTDLVFQYFKAAHIGVDEAPDLDAALTQEETDYLQEYLDSIAALPVLSDGEREALHIRAHAGEAGAKGELIEAYLTHVADIARLYADQGVYLEDLIGQGNVALTHGVTMIDAVEHPKEIEGFLMKYVMDAMEALIAETLHERAKDNKALKKVSEVAEKAHELAEDLRRKVTVKELAEETDFTEEEIREAMRISGYQIEDIEG